MRGTILVVDDEPDTASVIAESLQRRGFGAEAVRGGNECLARMDQVNADVVVTDVMMPMMSGLELCSALRSRYPEVLPIVLTGQGGLDIAVSAIRAGAYDYIMKPVTMAVLEIAVTRALVHVELRRELVELRRHASQGTHDGVIGKSDAILKALDLVHRVAASDATVLITGESGTGKEMIARAVHHESPRRHEPFVAINCAALPSELLESELFGHVRGAFTDASRSRQGLFVQAGHGTIFLDEIGDMPIEMQVKLLRVVQERKVRAVGSDEELPINARVIASTNRDLEQAIAEKRFREDLYYRLNVVAIDVPPLRARQSDVLLLAHYFLMRIADRIHKAVIGITAPAAKLLAAYAWPGNVRELENCIERAVALCRLDQLTVEDLPSKLYVPHEMFVVPCAMPSELVSLAEMSNRYVRDVVDKTGGNKSHAARVLGIDRRSLYRRLVTGDHGASEQAIQSSPTSDPVTEAPVNSAR